MPHYNNTKLNLILTIAFSSTKLVENITNNYE